MGSPLHCVFGFKLVEDIALDTSDQTVLRIKDNISSTTTRFHNGMTRMSIQKCEIRSRQNTSVLSFYRPPTLTPLNDYDPRKILKAGLAGDVERHPSVVNIASKQRTTRNILETLEAKLNHLVQVIPNIASAIEEKFNDFLATVSKMPAASGEKQSIKFCGNSMSTLPACFGR